MAVIAPAGSIALSRTSQEELMGLMVGQEGPGHRKSHTRWELLVEHSHLRRKCLVFSRLL